MSQTTLPELPDITEVTPVGTQDQACIAEVRAVLERHGALQRFGLTLLHQHFEMNENEILVESVDTQSRVLTIRPTKVNGTDGIETSWRLDDPAAMQRCETMCQPDRDAQGNPIHFRPHYTTG